MVDVLFEALFPRKAQSGGINSLEQSRTYTAKLFTFKAEERFNNLQKLLCHGPLRFQSLSRWPVGPVTGRRGAEGYCKRCNYILVNSALACPVGFGSMGF